MDDAFKVHTLTDEGKNLANEIALEFDELLSNLSQFVEGRYLAIVRTKLEEACFFAKKGMAENHSQIDVVH